MRYLSTILIFLFLFFTDSSLAISKIRKIGDKYVPTNPRYDIYVVEVVEKLVKNPTNENPPKVKMKIIESLRGKIKPEQQVIGIWYSHAGPDDRVALSKKDEDKQWYRRPINKEWYKKPFLLPTPNVGEKIIIFTNRVHNSKKDRVGISSFFPYTSKNREIVLDNMVSRIPQTLTSLIFGFLFILLILKIVFYFDPQTKKGYIREQFVKVLPYLLPLELLLYGYYHYETSKHYDIRIDLLFLIPAFFATIIFSALILSRNSSKETLPK